MAGIGGEDETTYGGRDFPNADIARLFLQGVFRAMFRLPKHFGSLSSCARGSFEIRSNSGTRHSCSWQLHGPVRRVSVTLTATITPTSTPFRLHRHHCRRVHLHVPLPLHRITPTPTITPIQLITDANNYTDAINHTNTHFNWTRTPSRDSPTAHPELALVTFQDRRSQCILRQHVVLDRCNEADTFRWKA